MSRKTIVLADNSYTIRRIVELSFSDETDIELVTFENGLNLKEKLVELRPQIILVDITNHTYILTVYIVVCIM